MSRAKQIRLILSMHFNTYQFYELVLIKKASLQSVQGFCISNFGRALREEKNIVGVSQYNFYY